MELTPVYTATNLGTCWGTGRSYHYSRKAQLGTLYCGIPGQEEKGARLEWIRHEEGGSLFIKIIPGVALPLSLPSPPSKHLISSFLLALPLISWKTLGKSLHIAGPLFPATAIQG